MKMVKNKIFSLKIYIKEKISGAKRKKVM